jgi:hypothetical protein
MSFINAMSISNPEIKKLYGLSAGRCNICRVNLFENEVHIGQMAHVIAKSLDGPRGSQKIFGSRNSYDNLILLCANHHCEVDQNPENYSVEKLQQIKYEHENYIKSLFNSTDERKNDIVFLNSFMEFVPFIKLPYFVEYLPRSVNLDLCLIGDMFDALTRMNHHLYPMNDIILQQYFESFLSDYQKLWKVIAGSTFVDDYLQPHFSQADDRFYLNMERRFLPYNVIEDLNRQLEILKSNFIDSYIQLTTFLRSNYKEVNLSLYQN